MASLVSVFQSRRQILGDSLHSAGPDGFDARPFHGVEHGARRLCLGRPARVSLRIVARETQGDRIRLPSQNGDVIHVHPARRFGQAGFALIGRANSARLFGSERYFQFGRLSHRAETTGDRAFQRFMGRLTRRSRPLIRKAHPGNPIFALPPLPGLCVLNSRRHSRRFPAAPCRRTADRIQPPTGVRVRRICSGTSGGRRSRHLRISRNFPPM